MLRKKNLYIYYMNEALRYVLIILLYIFHIVIDLYIAVGVFFTPTKYLDYYVIFAIAVVLLWSYTDKKCIITYIQNKLENNKYRDGFTYHILKKICSDKSAKIIENIIVAMGGLSYLYACYRLNNINYAIFMAIVWTIYKN